MDPKLIQQVIDALVAGDGAAALKLLQALLVQAAGGDATDPAGSDPTQPTGDTPPKEGAMPGMPAKQSNAAPTLDGPVTAALCAMTGKTSAGEAIEAVRGVLATVARLNADQTALDNTSRIELVGELVKLGAEVPATAWADAEKKVPAAHLAAEPLASLRNRVTQLRNAKPAARQLTAPTASPLSDQEEKAIAHYTPAQRARYIELRATRTYNRRVD